MAVVNREQIGWIDCPMCEQTGTVHETKIGRGGTAPKLYWRNCGCGCVQPWGAAGQAFVRDNMRPMGEGPAEVSPDVPEKATHPEENREETEPETSANEAQETGKNRKRRGILSGLGRALMEDDA